MKKALNWIFGILLLVSLILNGILVYKQCNQNTPECIEIIKNDTLLIVKDSIITKYKYRTHYDTIFTTVFIDTNSLDTIKKLDTLQIPIDYKQASFKTSKDSIDLEAKIQYHGYKAEIDSVEFAYQLHYTQEITKPKQKKIGLVWNIGPYVGYGINFNNGQYYFSPEVGIGGSIGIGGIIK